MIDILDMDDVTPEDKGEDKQPPAAAAPVVPQIDPRQMAGEITQSILSGLSSQFQNTQNANIIEATAREMAAKGVPPVAIEAIIKMNLAFQQESSKALQEQEQKKEVQNFVKAFWKQADELFDRYEAKLSKEYPGLSYAKQGIIDAYKNTLETDPAFRQDWQRMEVHGQLPSLSSASKAMAKVIEDCVTKMGGKKEPAMVSLGGAKPQQTSTTGGDLKKLDARQLSMYRTFRKTKGDEFDAKAYERALKS